MSRIFRSRSDKMLAGICGGVAASTGFEVTWLRLLVVVVTLFTGGAFALVYLACIFVIPQEPPVYSSFTANVGYGGPGKVYNSWFSGGPGNDYNGGNARSHAGGYSGGYAGEGTFGAGGAGSFHDSGKYSGIGGHGVDARLQELEKQELEKQELRKELEAARAQLAKYEQKEG